MDLNSRYIILDSFLYEQVLVRILHGMNAERCLLAGEALGIHFF